MFESPQFLNSFHFKSSGRPALPLSLSPSSLPPSLSLSLPNQYKMEASFLEIYNEALRDLLSSSSSEASSKLEIRISPTNSSDVYVTNLTPVTVTSEAQVGGVYSVWLYRFPIRNCSSMESGRTTCVR